MIKLLTALMAISNVTSAVPAGVEIASHKTINTKADNVDLGKDFQGYLDWGTTEVPEQFDFQISTNFNIHKVDEMVDNYLEQNGANETSGFFWQWLETYLENNYISRTIYDYQTGKTGTVIVPHGSGEPAFYKVIYTALKNPYGITVGTSFGVNIMSGNGGHIDISKFQRFIDGLTNDGKEPVEFNQVGSLNDISIESVLKNVDHRLFMLNVEGNTNSSEFEENYLFNLAKKDNIDVYFEKNGKISYLPFIPVKGEEFDLDLKIDVLPNPNDIYVDNKQIDIKIHEKNPFSYDISIMQEAFSTPVNEFYDLISGADFDEVKLMGMIDYDAKVRGVESETGDIPNDLLTLYFGDPGIEVFYNGGTRGGTDDIIRPNPNGTALNTAHIRTKEAAGSQLTPGKALDVKFTIKDFSGTKEMTTTKEYKSGYEPHDGWTKVGFDEQNTTKGIKSTVEELYDDANVVKGSARVKRLYLSISNAINYETEFLRVVDELNKNPDDYTKVKLTGMESYSFHVFWSEYKYQWFLNGEAQPIFQAKDLGKNPNLKFVVELSYDVYK